MIRTDSSSVIGSGHMMRNLTLAAALQQSGAKVIFVSRDLPGNLCDEAEKHFQIHRIKHGDDGPSGEDFRSTIEILRAEAPVDWLIVDHYSLDKTWESGIRKEVGHIMVIDDLANRPHDCNLLLDQNLYADSKSRYNGLVPDHCKKLLGPQYALLRTEFATACNNLRHRDGSIKRIMISMGGADPHNVTAMVLEGVKLWNRHDLFVDVVVGAANPHIETIRDLCLKLPVCDLHHPANNMAALMTEADLCIGAAGSTTWERCCLGLPTLFIASGDNEIEIAGSADKAGIGKYQGRYDEVDPEMIADELSKLVAQPNLIIEWSNNAASLVDGCGAERVCRAVMERRREEVGS